MLLKKIKLHNIRSYVDGEMEFPPSSVLLSGDIGSGKSSILLAIEFALFGAEQVSGYALLRNGKNEGHVELQFELDGKDIVVWRGLKRSGNGAIGQSPGSITIDNVKRDGTSEELRALMIEMLGYPKELAKKKKNPVYRFTVYCPQEEMKAIIEEKEEVRLDLLRKVFGFDKYKQIRENCSTYVRELKGRQKELAASIADLEVKKKELELRKEELNGVNEKITVFEPMIMRLQEEIILKENELEDVEKKIKELSEDKNRLDVLQSRKKFVVDQNEQNEGRIEAILEQIKRIEVDVDVKFLEAEIAVKEKELNSLVVARDTASFKKRVVIGRIDEISKEIESFSMKTVELETKQKQLHDLELDIKGKQSALDNKEKTEQSLKKTLSLR